MKPINRQRGLVLAGVVTVIMLAGCARSAAPTVQSQPEHSPNYDPAKPVHAPANFDPSWPGAVACSSTIVSGTVLKVVDGAPGHMITTLQVQRWVKPATGPRRVELNTVDIAAEGVYPRWQPNQNLYLVIDLDPNHLPEAVTRPVFDKYIAAVRSATRLECGYGPS